MARPVRGKARRPSCPGGPSGRKPMRPSTQAHPPAREAGRSVTNEALTRAEDGAFLCGLRPDSRYAKATRNALRLGRRVRAPRPSIWSGLRAGRPRMGARAPRSRSNAREAIRGRGLVATLERILRLEPIANLINQLARINRTGRPPTYPPRVMVAVALARVLFKAPCWTDILELLREHSDLRRACGIQCAALVPSRDACYRLTAKLRRVPLLAECGRRLVDLVAGRIPGFAHAVAADATHIEAYACASKTPPSDREARWGTHHSGNGHDTRFFLGYKLHLMVDADHQIPIRWVVTPADVNEVERAIPLFDETARRADWFRPQFAIMDRAYDAVGICRVLEAEHGCHPIIPQRLCGTSREPALDGKGRPRCVHGPWIWKGTDYTHRRTKWVCPYENDPRVHEGPGCGRAGRGRRCWLSWRRDPRRHKLVPEGSGKFDKLYAKRVSVEREFSLLKQCFMLDTHRVRGLDRVAVHVNLCLVVRLATAALSLPAP